MLLPFSFLDLLITKATGLMMTADPISADDAFNIGMIYKVYDTNDFENEAFKTC